VDEWHGKVDPMTTIVVGTDGSPNAQAALQWALDHARRNGARLRVVHAWYYPYAASETGAMAAPTVADFEEASRQALDAAVQALDTTGVEVERCLRQGNPSAILLEEAKSADMLVVGARGHGGFVGLVLGSVATHCTRHAHVPTVVVPAA
jgi:nucleotide-binding universal stress UspA family protein